MKTKLAILAMALAIFLVAAAPALAQSASEEAVIIGVIEPVTNPGAEGPTHIITEDVTGDQYGLFSDAQGVNLSQSEGLFVTVSGIFQTQGNPLSDFDNPTDVPIYVTSVEVIGDPNSPPGTTTPATGPVTFSFELAVEGAPPADASFFGVFGYEGGMVQLTDPDSDGLYTSSVETSGSLEPQPVSIIQGTGTQPSRAMGAQPGEPNNAGDQYRPQEMPTISMPDDPTTVPREPTTPPDDIKVLPDTGGLPLLAFGMGSLLLAGVLLVRRSGERR